MPTTAHYLFALLVTLAIEYPFVHVGFRGRRKLRPPWALLAAFVVVHMLTHGALWHLWPRLPGDYLGKLLVGETLVTLVEAAAYGQLLGVSNRRALLVSILANATSTVVGLAIWKVVL